MINETITTVLLLLVYCVIFVIDLNLLFMSQYGPNHSTGYQHVRFNPYYSQNQNHNHNDNHNHNQPLALALSQPLALALSQYNQPAPANQLIPNGAQNFALTQPIPGASNIELDPVIQQLIQPRARPGNPRPRSIYINKYGTFECETEPDFASVDCFDWVYYGFDPNDNKYKGIFRNIPNRQSIQQIKDQLNLQEIIIAKLSMRQREDKYSDINDICDDITQLFEENNPFKVSSKPNSKDHIRQIIKEAIEAGLTPEQFRVQQPEIAANKTNKIWYKNVYDGKQGEQEKIEQKEAVEWLQLNRLQTQIVQLMEQEWDNFNTTYDTNSKKILMGNRHGMFVIVSPDGGVGLTTTCKYMMMKHGSDTVILISGGGKPSDVIYNYHSQLEKASNCKYLFWNIARDDWKHFRWTSVEEICDAISTSNKYNSETKMKPPPVLILATNKMFDLKDMTTNKPVITLDRIKLYRVKRSVVELERVDVFEFYLKKYGDDPRIEEQKEDSDFDIANL
eukprot:555988_1